jgi:hypothetical protein
MGAARITAGLLPGLLAALLVALGCTTPSSAAILVDRPMSGGVHEVWVDRVHLTTGGGF